MNRIGRLYPLLLVFFALTSPAFALQEDSEGDAQRAQQRAMDDALREQQAAQIQADADAGQTALRDFIRDNGKNPPQPTRSEEQAAKFKDFRTAVPKFRAATRDFRWALSMDNRLGKPLKEIETEANVLLRYLSSTKVKHPQPDSAEFKTYSQNELAWETLNSAERISSYLDLAVKVEQQKVVAPKMMEFMFQLDGELLRLKWLATHVKG